GLAYNNQGRLFAKIGPLVQHGPRTGATLQTSPAPGGLDGLTFDPFTGMLFATDGRGGHLFRFDPNNLSAGGQLVATLIAANGFADGPAADGKGHVFVAVRNLAAESQSGLDQVDVTTGMFTRVAVVPVIDDVAPLVGLGAPPAVPEPSTLAPPRSAPPAWP